jgi:hypothetical protein
MTIKHGQSLYRQNWKSSLIVNNFLDWDGQFYAGFLVGKYGNAYFHAPLICSGLIIAV